MASNRFHSRGITLIGFVIVLCVLGLFAYAAMRLVPVYVEYNGVSKAMDMVAKEPGASNKTLDQIRQDLGLKFSIQYVDEKSVPPSAIRVVRQGGGVTLNIAYQRRLPFIANVDLLVSFDRSVAMTGAANY